MSLTDKIKQTLNFVPAYSLDNLSSQGHSVPKKSMSQKVIKYTVKYGKDAAIIGSSIWFILSNPVLSLIISANMYMFVNSIYKEDKQSKYNFCLGIGLYSAAIFSFFNNRLLSVSLGWGCSVASNVSEAVIMSALGVNIPGVIYGPVLLLSNVWVKLLSSSHLNKMPEGNILNKTLKTFIKSVIEGIDDKLFNSGYQYFETIGHNYLKSINNLIPNFYDHLSFYNAKLQSNINECYSKVLKFFSKNNLEDEYVLVDKEEVENLAANELSSTKADNKSYDTVNQPKEKYTSFFRKEDSKPTFTEKIRSNQQYSHIRS